MSDTAVLEQPQTGEMEAKSRTPQHVTKGSDWDPNTGLLTVKWADDQDSTFDMAQVPQEIRNDLMYHGLLARIQQSYVSAKGSASVARDKATKLFDTLKAGEWGLSRGEKSYSITVQALSALMDISLEEADRRFNAKSKDAKVKIGKRPDVRKKIAELRALESEGKLVEDLSAAL